MQAKLVWLVLFGTVACGQQELTADVQNSSLQSGDDVAAPEATGGESDAIPMLGLATTGGTIQVTTATFAKVSTAMSSALSTTQKCKLNVGDKFTFASSSVSGDHIFVSFDGSIPCNSLKSAYFYSSHVKVAYKPTFSVTTIADTKFKISTADSAGLKETEKCFVAKGTKLYLKADVKAVSNSHVEVDLAEGTLTTCPVRHGFFYAAHLDSTTIQTADNDFARVMRPILLWEGGCSDDAADYGGRTYMGITTSRARQNNWTADVCTMPKDMVLDIYRKDYWVKHAVNYGWPLNLAVMNTEVNSGGGRAQIFIDRMAAQNITGTLVEKAKWFVDQQTQFYRNIVANDSSQSVFINGWLNRSNHMQKVISGEISLTGEEFEISHTAKAIANDDPEM